MLRIAFLRRTALPVLLIMAVGFSACKKDDDNKPSNDPPAVDSPQVIEAKGNVVDTYTKIAVATYEDALATARTLDQKAQAFVANPTAAGLEDLKAAWKAARVPYDQTDAFRFYGGPIDDPTTGVEGLLNAWPLDENYIDYTDGLPSAGIINDVPTYPTISKAVLDSLNEQGGEKNISVGYHAIEFLLWGQDLSATGPGARPYTDYLTGPGATAPNGARRGEYLKACTSLLVDHLQYVVSAWATYRNTLSGLPKDAALQKIMFGLGSLSKGELAGERMKVALDNQDQEDEHSCFSDYTDQDLKGNAQGVRNVITGTYRRTNGTTVSGPSLADAVRVRNAAQADALLSASQNALTKTQAIQSPFDQEIIGGPGVAGYDRVYNAVLANRALGDQLVQSAQTLGITLIF